MQCEDERYSMYHLSHLHPGSSARAAQALTHDFDFSYDQKGRKEPKPTLGYQ